VLQLPLHRFKGVVDDLGQGLVRAIVHLALIGYELVAPRYGHVNADPHWVSFVMRMIRLFDGDITSDDMITKFFEPSCVIENKVLYLV
jgi:hypothetical protein